jgi:hypothetical protein
MTEGPPEILHVVIGVPPSFVGSDQFRVADVPEASAIPAVGAEGIETARKLLETLDVIAAP